MAESNGQLAALMEEANFSRKSLARAVVQAAARAGRDIPCDHTYVGRWLKGAIPRGDVPQFIADAVSKKLGRRVGLDDIGMGDAAVSKLDPEVGLSFAATPETLATTVADLWRADRGEAEALLRAHPDPSAWNAASMRWLVAPADQLNGHAGAQKVGLVDVDRIRTTTAMFDQLDGQFGGGHGRRALIEYLHSGVRPMLDGEYTSAVARELYRAVAEALMLAAWMSYDSGIHGVAQRYFIQALRMTHAAGDRMLGGSVLSAMSHQATFIGRYDDAATLARAALSGSAGTLTPTMTAQFKAMEARALARLGDSRACELALADSERHLGLATDDSDPEYIRYFDQTELAAEAGHCFRDLGHSLQATARGARSIFGDGLNNRSDFFATMVQAESHLGGKELAQGCAIALDALRLGEGLQSARCVQYVREFRARLAPDMQRTAEFREFEEQARGYRLWQESG